MAVYNASAFLTEAIESVKTQSYSRWELICVNDGSTDDSLSILEVEASKDPRIRIINQTHAGAAIARNTALGVSRGKYVCILDADDHLSSDYLAKTLQAIEEDETYDCAMPELYIWYWQDESRSYSCNENFSLPHLMSGLQALELSIPWRLHALCLWNGDMMRSVGYRCDGYITSDEVSSRDFFAHCRKVVQCGGRYYYRYNDQSITKKVSCRPIEKVMTNIQLRELAISYGLPKLELQRITTDFFFELIAWTMYYVRNRHFFTFSEQRRGEEMLRTAYRYRCIREVRPNTLNGWLKKMCLGYHYDLFMLVCHIMSKIHERK